MLSLGHILAAFGGYTIKGSEQALTTVEIDSREVKKGSLFIAFPGEQVDGHDFVADAFANGAIGAVVHRPIEGFPMVTAGQPLESVPQTPFCIQVEKTEAGLQQIARYWRNHFEGIDVIGITGSVGKTSTKELTYEVLSQRFNTLKTPKNYNNEIGLPLTLLQLATRHSHAVLEMGMYAKGEIALLAEIARPRVGVVTNIGPVHLSRMGTIEAIVEAKRELIEALPAAGVAILNQDDEHVIGMASHTEAQIFTYGMTPDADLWASSVTSQGLEGIRFSLNYQGDVWHLNVPLLGRHSVHTALRAAAVGLACSMSWEEIILGLQKSQSQLRLVTVRGPRNSLIIDDSYNASPASVIAALNLLADLGGRKIAVLGDMLELGSAEEAGHRLVGRRALEVADLLVTVGERGKIISDEARLAGMTADRLVTTKNTAEAAEQLTNLIEAGDIVLIKGSLGAQMDRIVAALSRTKENIHRD
ncbi:MAG: UDP-N-acetylmuramoyl-tripeptide--D-alanyl-D-alanine ligase [Ardenticatenaceae bacterium]|nr:UDP-N-acetylmuramoyl-tripeptide--D-alanyl-D-alanine ligase [Ardenticatenaceae bacterium]